MPPNPTLSPAPTKLYPLTPPCPHAVLILCRSASKDLKERTQFYGRKTHPTLSCKTTYINHLSPSPENTNPFSRLLKRRPIYSRVPVMSPVELYPVSYVLYPLLTPESCLLTPVLNKRTQFCSSETRITPFPAITYLHPFCPALSRTNPISPAPLPVPRPPKILTTASSILTPLYCYVTYYIVYPVFYLLSPLLTPVFCKTNPISPVDKNAQSPLK
jgi:hypothetical protein